MRLIVMTATVVCAVAGAAWAQETVTFPSLLKEMTDRKALTYFPKPAYRCLQESSYDRRSKTPEDKAGWFANDDCANAKNGGYVRIFERQGKREFVMADLGGPGAVVRVWSANPKGTLRIYLDGDPEAGAAPFYQGSMADLLGGKGKLGACAIGEPFAGERSKGWNLYLPIPFAKRCVITSDEDGFYYHVNWRSYGAGTKVETLTAEGVSRACAAVGTTGTELTTPVGFPDLMESGSKPEGVSIKASMASGAAVTGMRVRLDPKMTNDDLRRLAVRIRFDGTETVWCPLGDFFGIGAGGGELHDFYRNSSAKELSCSWVMPYQKDVEVRIEPIVGAMPEVRLGLAVAKYEWNERSMYFHARWRTGSSEVVKGAGTRDWEYLRAKGPGVFVGDNLSVVNPVSAWWGEGDEKIYVDGEKFPSHFGTGTEDYYGYAWCWNVPFNHVFHAQPRCDGQDVGGNLGHTSVTRVRSLDAIPFTASFAFDMEQWHWEACTVRYSSTAYFYSREAQKAAANPELAGVPAPKFEIFAIPRAIEAETLKFTASPGVACEKQDMSHWGTNTWSRNAHLWVKGKNIGDSVELKIPVEEEGARKVTLYATKSWDYGIVRFTLNNEGNGPEVDLFSGKERVVTPTGPIELGKTTIRDGFITVRCEVIGSNAGSFQPKTYFGIDAVVVEAVK